MSAAAEVEAPPGPVDELARLRGEIERIDRQIVELIAERVALARQVGPIKHALGIPTLDPPREAAIVRRAGELARMVFAGAATAPVDLARPGPVVEQWERPHHIGGDRDARRVGAHRVYWQTHVTNTAVAAMSAVAATHAPKGTPAADRMTALTTRM